MTRLQLFEQIRKKRSFLCIGLDPEPERLPAHLAGLPHPVFEFNRQIIDATHHLAVAYKPNLAFYECLGTEGWEQFGQTVSYLRKNHPGLFVIADAKRGDIGNTARKYAETFYSRYDCDAVTLAPYMGEDSVRPFLEYPGKWGIVLGLTSNAGASDFQMLHTAGNTRLFESVLAGASKWGHPDNLMFVAGATRAGMLMNVRAIVPDHFLLVPGIGAQGGDIGEVAAYGMNGQCGLLVNASRSIIYAHAGRDFASAAAFAARAAQVEMEAILVNRGLLT